MGLRTARGPGLEAFRGQRRNVDARPPPQVQVADDLAHRGGRLLRQAVAAGALFSVDTDAHAPGQLDWQIIGCARAEECGVPPERVVNTWPVQDVLSWTRTSRSRTTTP